MKELLKLVNICQSYRKNNRVSFFMAHSVLSASKMCSMDSTVLLIVINDIRFDDDDDDDKRIACIMALAHSQS